MKTTLGLLTFNGSGIEIFPSYESYVWDTTFKVYLKIANYSGIFTLQKEDWNLFWNEGLKIILQGASEWIYKNTESKIFLHSLTLFPSFIMHQKFFENFSSWKANIPYLFLLPINQINLNRPLSNWSKSYSSLSPYKKSHSLTCQIIRPVLNIFL